MIQNVKNAKKEYNRNSASHPRIQFPSLEVTYFPGVYNTEILYIH